MNVPLSLRPARLVGRLPKLRVMVASLLQSLKSLGTLFGVLLFCATAFAIMGVQLFKARRQQQTPTPHPDLNAARKTTADPNSAPPRLSACLAGD